MSPPKISLIPIEKLHRRPDARARTDEAVAALAESIEQTGLINPIRVRLRDLADGYEVVAGSHRLQAIDALGWHEVPCIVVDDDDLHAELAMIDENLCRAELTPADRAQQTARRKAIYLELHPETAHGGNLEGAGVAKLASPETPAFSRVTAQITGQSERTVQRDATRGENIVPSVLEYIKETPLNTGTYLDKLARARASDQMAMAKRDLAWRRQQDSDKANVQKRGGIAGRYAPTETPSPSKVFDRFVALVDEIETLPIADLVTAAGPRRAVLNHRASSLADRMDEIMRHGD